MSVIADSKEYVAFRKHVGCHRRIVDFGSEQKEWKCYDLGPKSIKSPIICLPSASAGAESFFYQIMHFGSSGYRVIAVCVIESGARVT